MRYSALSIAPLLLAPAAASNCFNFGVGPAGVCNNDQSDTGKFEAYIVQDHANASCASGGTFNMAINYVGTNGQQYRQSALNSYSAAPAFTGTIPFNFNVLLASIGTASPVTLTVTAQGTTGTALKTTFTYSQEHLSTISYTTSTTTWGTWSTATKTATLTLPVTHTSTVTNTALATVTANGTLTTTVTPAQVTSTVIITPAPQNATMHKYTTISSTLTCASPAPILVKAKVAAAVTYDIPFCGAVSTLTITNAVSTASTTTTVYDTVTSLLNSIVWVTSTKAAPTKQVSVTTTKTITAPVPTFTSYIKAVRVSSTVTLTTTVYRWEKPRSADASLCSANAPQSSPTSRLTLSTPVPTTTAKKSS